MSRAVQKYAEQAKWGRIVSLSSTSALGNRGQAVRGREPGCRASPKTLAIELGRFGITANAIAPGFIETEMTQATAERISAVRGVPRRGGQEHRSRPVGKPEDIANAVAFLVSDGAGFISGQTLYVSGGPAA